MKPVIYLFSVLSITIISCSQQDDSDELPNIRFCDLQPEAERISEAKRLRFDLVWENGNFSFYEWNSQRRYNSCLPRDFFSFEDSVDLTVEFVFDAYYQEEDEQFWLYPIGGIFVDCLPPGSSRDRSMATFDEVFEVIFISDSTGREYLPLCVEEKPFLTVEDGKISGSLGANTFSVDVLHRGDSILVVSDFLQTLALHPSVIGARFEKVIARVLGADSPQESILTYKISSDTLYLSNFNTKDKAVMVAKRD